VADTTIIAPISEAVLINAQEEVAVIAPQETAVVVEVRAEAVIITPQPEVVIVEVRRGPVGPPGPTGAPGADGADGTFPDGSATGDIIRWNAVSGAWESAAEPFEFRGIVLVPIALPGGVVAEGFIGYNAADKGIYVQID
jgi:hypothetical protein